MYDAGLYPLEAIKLMRERWQETQGRASHDTRMKDAGDKAASLFLMRRFITKMV